MGLNVGFSGVEAACSCPAMVQPIFHANLHWFLSKISCCQDLYCVNLIFNFLFLENGLPKRREVSENDV